MALPSFYPTPFTPEFNALLAVTSCGLTPRMSYLLSLRLHEFGGFTNIPLDRVYSYRPQVVLSGLRRLAESGVDGLIGMPKIHPYYLALCGDLTQVPIDRWVSLWASKGTVEKPSATQRARWTARIRREADRLGIAPAHRQEQIWTSEQRRHGRKPQWFYAPDATVPKSIMASPATSASPRVASSTLR